MFWLQFISKFIKVMRAGASPGQIAGGFSLGFLIGLMPFLTLQSVIIFCMVFLLNINLSAATFAIFIASFGAFLLDPLFHHLGFHVLTGIPALHGLWTALYNMPVAPLTRFNNTVVMGSFISGMVLLAPVFYGMKKLVVVYRSGLEAKIKQWKIVQIITGSKLWQWYERIRDLQW
ncbi:MAG: TIGR03546 family protein [candidate division KSB1 bacterium]|nr:TIGR03546 family protein [candidate division KSB1 bacterium]MDZ7313986.1 TIGR03546 family protein [candidate division KSB1 bacterium]